MFERLIGSLRRRREARNSGTVLVELALTVPILLALVVGVADYGVLMGSSDNLTAATRAGAEIVKARQTETAAQLTAITPSIFPAGATVTVSAPFCTCVDNTSVTCPSAGATNPCAGKTDTRLLKYITVSATQSFSPLFNWASFLFPGTLNAAAIVRVE